MTPYYKEDVLFSSQALEEQNEDGVSILFYLQKIYPGSMANALICECTYLVLRILLIIKLMPLFNILADEWKNFLERVNCKTEEELRETEQSEEELRLWASYRGQTLTRTGIFLFVFSLQNILYVVHI